MEFRECRLLTIHEIFHVMDQSVAIEKTFLAVGGIKAAVFIIKDRGIKYMVPSGFVGLGTSDVCNKLHIPFERVRIRDFLSKYGKNKEYTEENLFILPCSSTVLNVREVPDIERMMIGQSEILICRIDFEESRLYAKFDKNENEYWIDMKVLEKLENVTTWTENRPVEVLKIGKSDIIKSKGLRELLSKSNLELLKDVVLSYKNDVVEECDPHMVLLEGASAYDAIITFFNELLLKLSQVGDDSKKDLLLKYSKFLLRYFHMYLIAGSDGYYRNEFACALSYAIKNENIENEERCKTDWMRVAKMWRKLGRRLGAFMKSDSDVAEILTFLIQYIKEIKSVEIEIIDDMEQSLCNI